MSLVQKTYPKRYAQPTAQSGAKNADLELDRVGQVRIGVVSHTLMQAPTQRWATWGGTKPRFAKRDPAFRRAPVSFFVFCFVFSFSWNSCRRAKGTPRSFWRLPPRLSKKKNARWMHNIRFAAGGMDECFDKQPTN